MQNGIRRIQTRETRVTTRPEVTEETRMQIVQKQDIIHKNAKINRIFKEMEEAE